MEETGGQGTPGSRPRVAYLMSRFPKLTETFVLYELLAVEQAGVDVAVYPLQREKTSVTHPEADAVVSRAHFTPWMSLPIMLAHAYFLFHRPWTYIRLALTLLRANVGSARYLGGAIAFFPKAAYIARHMQLARIDHIHAHFASHPAMVAFAIHELTGIPYSFTAHGSDLHRDQHMLREKVAKARFVATISDHNVEIICDHCDDIDTSHVKLLRCGVDTTVFRPTRDVSSPSKSRPLAIFCIGTLHEVKGQSILLRAAQLLKTGDRKTAADFSINFVGDGPDRNKLEREAKQLGLANITVFHGPKTRHDLARLLQSADLVVAPSVPTNNGRKEGIPVALMEAMATGIAVVASRLSGIPELVSDGHNGLLVTPGDVSELASSIKRAMVDAALRAQLSQEARRTVEANYNLESNALRLARLFCGESDALTRRASQRERPTHEMSPCS